MIDEDFKIVVKVVIVISNVRGFSNILVFEIVNIVILVLRRCFLVDCIYLCFFYIFC